MPPVVGRRRLLLGNRRCLFGLFVGSSDRVDVYLPPLSPPAPLVGSILQVFRG